MMMIIYTQQLTKVVKTDNKYLNKWGVQKVLQLRYKK